MILAVLIVSLACVSARTWAAEDSSFTRESRKPKASRRALLAATTRSTVSTNQDRDREDAPPPVALPVANPQGPTSQVSARKGRVLLLKITTPEYLLPYAEAGPAGLLSPPA
jgi:hypothetical protein